MQTCRPVLRVVRRVSDELPYQIRDRLERLRWSLRSNSIHVTQVDGRDAVLDHARGSRMMTRSSGELVIAERRWLAIQRLAGDGGPELFPYPLTQVDNPPGHDAMNCPDGTGLDDPRQCRAAHVVQPRRLTWSPAVDRPATAVRVERRYPVSDDLEPHPADLGAVGVRGAVLDRRQCQETRCLPGVLAPARRSSLPPRIEITAHRNRHGEPRSSAISFRTPVASGKPHGVSAWRPWYSYNSEPRAISAPPIAELKP